jgi:hypothetical protein
MELATDGNMISLVSPAEIRENSSLQNEAMQKGPHLDATGSDSSTSGLWLTNSERLFFSNIDTEKCIAGGRDQHKGDPQIGI